MKNKIILSLIAMAAIMYSCDKNNKPATSLSINPEAGITYKSGDKVTVKLNYPADNKPDSIVYLLDSTRFASKKDSSAVVLSTDTLSLGPKGITAKLYQGGKSEDISTNIVLLAAKSPDEYSYKIEKVYPHDTSSYTEGLLYHDGYLYESTGTKGQSTLRKVNLATGKAVQTAKLDPRYFGEGNVIIGNKIFMLTWKDPKLGLVYDKNTFKLLNTFDFNVGVEGWGMCFDGNKIYMDDSTNRIWFLDKDTYRQKGFIDVYDDKKAIDRINELEYIDGELYANVFTTDTILTINPKTGAVLKRIDMKNLWPESQRPRNFDVDNNVLNGIAWDEKGKRLFVTGKKWPHLYQVKLVKK